MIRGFNFSLIRTISSISYDDISTLHIVRHPREIVETSSREPYCKIWSWTGFISSYENLLCY